MASQDIRNRRGPSRSFSSIVASRARSVFLRSISRASVSMDSADAIWVKISGIERNCQPGFGHPNRLNWVLPTPSLDMFPIEPVGNHSVRPPMVDGLRLALPSARSGVTSADSVQERKPASGAGVGNYRWGCGRGRPGRVGRLARVEIPAPPCLATAHLVSSTLSTLAS